MLNRYMIISCSLILLLGKFSVSQILAQESTSSHFTACGGNSTVSFEYPSTWSVEEKVVTILDIARNNNSPENPEIIERIVPEIRLISPDRQSKIYVREIEPFYSKEENNNEWVRSHPISIVGNFGGNAFANRGAGRSESEWNDITINNQRAGITYFTREHFGFIRQGIILTMEVGYSNVLLEAETRNTDITDLETTVFTIAESMTSSRPKPNLDTSSVAPTLTTYFETNCVFTFNYPPGWGILVRSEQVQLFNNEEAKRVHSINDTLSSEQIAVEIISPTRLPSFFTGDFDPTTTPEGILQAYAIAEDLYPNGAITEMIINDMSVYRLAVMTEDEKVEGFIMAYDFGDGAYAIFSARSGKGGLVNFEEQLTQIAESIEYNPERVESE